MPQVVTAHALEHVRDAVQEYVTALVRVTAQVVAPVPVEVSVLAVAVVIVVATAVGLVLDHARILAYTSAMEPVTVVARAILTKGL